MLSCYEPKFIEKKSFGKVVFHFFFDQLTRNKNRLLGRHFETVQHYIFFPYRIMIVYSAYIYGANFSAKFRWKMVFYGWVPRNPLWEPTGVKVERVCKTREEEEENTITFRLKCIVIT